MREAVAARATRENGGTFRRRQFMVVGASVLVAGLMVACTVTADGLRDDSPLASSEDDLWAQVTAEFPDAERPDVSVIEEVTLDVWPLAQADCLTSAGFPSRVEDGGLSTSVQSAQREPFLIQSYLCAVQFPLRPEDTTPLDARELESLYNYFARDLVPCLESEGYQVGVVPTQQSFVERYYGETPWTPYLIIGPTVPLGDLASLEQACPQLPPRF